MFSLSSLTTFGQILFYLTVTRKIIYANYLIMLQTILQFTSFDMDKKNMLQEMKPCKDSDIRILLISCCRLQRKITTQTRKGYWWQDSVNIYLFKVNNKLRNWRSVKYACDHQIFTMEKTVSKFFLLLSNTL